MSWLRAAPPGHSQSLPQGQTGRWEGTQGHSPSLRRHHEDFSRRKGQETRVEPLCSRCTGKGAPGPLSLGDCPTSHGSDLAEPRPPSPRGRRNWSPHVGRPVRDLSHGNPQSYRAPGQQQVVTVSFFERLGHLHSNPCETTALFRARTLRSGGHGAGPRSHCCCVAELGLDPGPPLPRLACPQAIRVRGPEG